MIEIVPLVLEPAQPIAWLELKADPLGIVALEGEELGKVVAATPVRQLGAVEQHDAARHAAVEQLAAGAWPAEDRLPLHVPRQKVPDVGRGEDVGIHDHRAALVAHDFRGQEP